MKNSLLLLAVALCFCALSTPAQTYDGLTIPTTHPRLMGFSDATNLSTARAWWAANTPKIGTCGSNNNHNCEMVAFAHLMTLGTGSVVDCAPAISWAMPLVAAGANGQGFPAGSAQNELGSSLIIVYDFCHDELVTDGNASTFLTNFVNRWADSNSSNGGTLGYVCPSASSGLGLDNNFCWGNNRNAFDWGVASYWDYTDSNTNAKANLDQFFNFWPSFKTWAAIAGPGGGAGGVGHEGMAYGASNFSGGGPRDVLATAKAMGRDLFTETNFYRDQVYALIYGTTPSTTTAVLRSPQSNYTYLDSFPFDDGEMGSDNMFNPSGTTLSYQITDVPTMAANEYAGTNVAGYARTWLNNIQSQIPVTPYTLALDAGNTARSYSTLPLDYLAPGIEFLWARKAWDTSSTVVNLEMGDASEVAHVHPWAGNWQMWRGGRWLTRSTAGYSLGLAGYNSTSYIDSQMSASMNEILINPDNQGCTPAWPTGNTSGTCQGDGGEWRGQGLWSGGGNSNAVNPLTAPQPQRLESQPGYTYASEDITGTYYSGGYEPSLGETGQFENPAVEQVVREFVWVRDIETLIIFDRVQARTFNSVSASSMKRSFLAHCEASWTLVDTNHAECVNGSQELALTTLLPASPAYHVTNEAFSGGNGESASSGNEQYRLEVNDSPGAAQSYFLHVAQAMPSSGGTKLSPTVSLSGTTYTVTLDANHSLKFVQGASSSGGSITINGTTNNFTSGVEPYSITNSGPVWGNASTYSLTTSTSGSGSGTISGTNCPGSGLASGTAYTCTAAAGSGSTFVSLTDGCGGTVSGNTTSGKVTANCNVSAVFNTQVVTLTSITVTPATDSIVAGTGTQQYAAQCNYSDGTNAVCTSTVTWSSNDTAVATIASGGLASAVAAGSATITATSGSTIGSGALSVTSPSLIGITVTPATKSIVAGTGTEQYAAQCTYSNSATSNCTSAVTWSSSNPAAATISTSGLASAVAAGSATITATSGSITGSAALTVANPTLTGITVTPATTSIVAGSGTEQYAAQCAYSNSTTSNCTSTVTWSSSNAAAATISASGLASAVAAGNTNITATSGSVNGSSSLTVTGGALSLGLGDCSSTMTGTQYVAFGDCTLAASGGVAPYTYSWSSSNSYASLPEGLGLDGSSGTLSGTIYGQGGYTTQFVVTDSQSNTATTTATFEIAGNNTLQGCQLFPTNSAFHINVASLPVDTSPAAPIDPTYQSSTLHAFFGGTPVNNFPNGIPFLVVPSTQSSVTVNTLNGSNAYFTSGPIPAYAPIESTSNAAASGADNHVLVVQAGSGCQLYEMYQGVPPSVSGASSGAWNDNGNAYWSDLSATGTGAFQMLPNDEGSTDAAGLPVTPLVVNADEVIGTGTPTAPNGTVQHPIRFTVSQALRYYVWPATATAGGSANSCTGSYTDPTGRQLLQSAPPASCSAQTGPMGEIYRLKGAVSNPACAATSPQAAIIIQGLRNYGIILADNGTTGGLIGTPDARWNDNDLACLAALKLSDFEPVDVSSVIADTTQVTQGGTTYYVPATYRATTAAPVLSSIAVTPATSAIMAGTGTQQYAAQCTYADGSNADCTTTVAWSSGNAAAATIAAGGLASGVAAGVATITATTGAVTGTATLTVTNGSLTGIAVTPATASIVAGTGTQQYAAQCTYSDGTTINCTSNVMWSSSNPAAATITAGGLASAAAAGSTTIMATSGGISGSSALTVTSASLTGIAVTPATASIVSGTGTKQYAAQCTYSNSTVSNCTGTVTWSSSNSAAATVTSGGLASGIAAGTTTITASSGGVSGGGALTVTSPNLTGILVTPAAASIVAGTGTQQYAAQCTYSNSTTSNCTGSVNWSSSNPAAATIAPGGLASGIAAGTATIAATFGNISGSAALTVANPTLTGIAVTPATASIVVGTTTQQYAAQCTYSNSTTSNCTGSVTWSSSNLAAATIAAGGLASGIAAGSSTIKATSGSVTGSGALTVTSATLTGISVTPSTLSIVAGTGTEQYAAQCSYSNSTTSNCTSTVTWSSSNPAAATITAGGLATGVAAGTTTVTAASGSSAGTAVLTVTNPTLSGITVSPATASIVAGTGTEQYAAQCAYSNSTTSNCTSTVTWSSSNLSIATIAAGGMASGVSAGSATIRASSGSTTGTGVVTVTNPTLTGIMVTPATSSIAAGAGSQQYAARCTYSNSSTSDCTSTVAWSSNNPATATIAVGGLATGVAAGSATIKATSGSVSGTGVLTVTSPSLTGISVTPAAASIVAGTGTQQYTAQCTYSNSTTSNCTSTVVWSSSNPAAATIAPGGLATGMSAGSTTITALSGHITVAASLTVTSATLTSISVTPAVATIVAGITTQQYSARCVYSNSTTSNCTSTVTWSSSTPRTATIAAGGLVTGLVVGNTTITATSGSITGGGALTVTSATVTGIAITPSTASIIAGTGTQQFSAQCTFSNSSTSSCTTAVTWSSSNTAVATIAAGGLAAGVSAGSTTVSANFGSISAPANLTVTGPSLSAIAVTPTSSTIIAGTGSQQYVAQCDYSNGTSSVCTSTVTWSSSNPALATVTAGGDASALAAGTTTITAMSGSIAGSGVLMVQMVGSRPILNSGMWAWMDGSSAAASPGVPSATTGPGARSALSGWKDSTGNLWLFGGQGYDSAGTNGLLNDLWQFVPSTQEWALITGPSTVPAANAGWPGVYGTLGTPAAGNTPGGRQAATSSTDASGNLWLFGGAGYDSADANGSLNDLWKFDPSTQEWTWENGSSTVPAASSGQPGIYGVAGVFSAVATPGGRSGANSWSDSQGNLWLFGGIGYDSTGTLGSLNDLWEFNPSTSQWAWESGSSTVGSGGGQVGVYATLGSPSTTGVPSGRSQAVSWVDSAGDLWLFGGNGYDSAGTRGNLNDLWEYNPTTREWSWMGGSNTIGCAGCGLPGIYGTMGQADPANGPGGRSQAVGWTDNEGNLWLFGGSGIDSTGTNGTLNDLWEYVPSTLEWAWMGGSSTVPGAKEGDPGIYGLLGVPAAENSPGGRVLSGGWSDGAGNLWLFGGTGYDASDTDGNLNDLWVYELSAGSLQAATPRLSTASGTYNTTQTVTITDVTPGATIYYTTNGAAPTAGSTVYRSPLTVSSTTMIQAIAVAPGYKPSNTASDTYTLVSPFTIAVASSSGSGASVPSGGIATYTLVVTPQGSATFPAAISLTASGLPPGSTAMFTPANLAAGIGTSTVSMSVQTTATTAAIVPVKSTGPWAVCLLFLPFFGFRRWRALGKDLSAGKWTAAGILVIAGVCAALTGCSGLVVLNPQAPVSAPASYTVTVSAISGDVEQSTTVTLTVE